MQKPETDLEKLRLEARRWDEWEPAEVIEAESQLEDESPATPEAR